MQNTLQEKLISNLPLTKREIAEYYNSNSKKINNLKTGLEYERISLDSRTYETACYNNIAEIIRNFALIRGWDLISDSNIIIGATDGFSSLTLEPGGQFEISLEPKYTLDEIFDDIKYYVRLIDKIAEFNNVTFLSYGINPHDTYQDIDIVNKKRYEIMARYLPNKGRLAPVMMRETAGVQVNIDYTNGEDAIYKLKAAAMMSPFMTGYYANSPIRGNEFTGYKSFRAFAWKNTGYDRCNLFYKNLINSKMGQSFEDYIDAILKVPMIFIERNGEKIEIMGRITFDEFMKKGYMGYGATLEDYKLHSSLCFPDIRLKNCIEIRNHDSQNILNSMSICALYKGILYDKRALEDIFELLGKLKYDELEQLGYDAAKYGLDFEVPALNAYGYEIASEIFKIARKSLPVSEKDYLDNAVWMTSNKKCSADAILDNNITDAAELINYLNNK